MNRREEALSKVKEYFDIWELVDQKVFDKYGERAWRFIDTDLIECLLIVRESLGKPITINTWRRGGSFYQRGLRTNVQPLVSSRTQAGKLYLTAHLMGKAVDFDVRGYTAEEVRNKIKEMKFPCKIRLEHNKNGTPINWVHLDVISEPHNNDIYLFDV